MFESLRAMKKGSEKIKSLKKEEEVSKEGAEPAGIKKKRTDPLYRRRRRFEKGCVRVCVRYVCSMPGSDVGGGRGPVMDLPTRRYVTCICIRVCSRYAR